MTKITEFLVDKTDLTKTKITERNAPALKDGEVLAKVRKALANFAKAATSP